MPHFSIFLPHTPTHAAKYIDYYLPPKEANISRWQIVNVQLDSDDEEIENVAQLLASIRAHSSAYLQELDSFSAILNERVEYIQFMLPLQANPIMDGQLELATISIVQNAVLKRCVPLIFFDTLLKCPDDEVEIGAIFPLPYSNHFEDSDSDSEMNYDSVDDALSDSELH